MAMPGGLSSDAYLQRRLRPPDSEHYSAAGILPYRKKDGAIEVLVAKERPWNSMTQSYDPLAWNVFGGKRIPRQEKSADTTAIRCFLDTICDIPSGPPTDVLQKVIGGSFCIWYPLGKFALLIADVTNENLDDLPEKFESSKPKDGQKEEFRINELGIKRWVKNIDVLEWVSGQNLAAADGELSDLLVNFLKVKSFKDFLDGTSDPAADLPASEEGYQNYGQNGGGKGKGWSDWGGGKKGKDKGYGKGKGGMGWSKGGPMPMMSPMGPMGPAPMAPMPMKGGPPMMNPYMGGGKGMPNQMAPLYYNQPYAQEGATQSHAEIQRQMYGEQLYVMVQPLSPSPYFAQKITGMLLELPENELIMNLSNQEELTRRVKEALDVLREDGLIS